MSVRTGSAVTLMALLSAMACSAEQTDASTGSAALGSALGDITKMPDLFTGSWGTMAGFVEDNAKLVPPFTPKAQKYVDAYQHKRDIPYAEDGCRSPGLPIAMRIGGPKFSYSPGLISIYMGTAGHTRFIKMNQKQGLTSPKYYGNSVGHWEGDTLVVETKDFAPEITFQYGVGTPLPPLETIGTASLGPPPAGALPGRGPPDGGPRGGVPGEPAPSLTALSAAIWGPHGEDMHMVERMQLVKPDTLVIKTTIYDDTVWTQPYEMASRTYRRRAADPEEWICTISVTAFDPDTNTYVDKDPEEMVKYLDKQGKF